ncbi:MAG: acylphosphatase [Planctomycetota bacterium]|nr:acylphosphatase [Planctomycetota bacterium]MDG1985304.1 acylphosphatase [Planctomycetota bacterium]
MEARLVRLGGRVQGVGFRWHARLEARALRVAGWVRNLEDGGVEAHCEGHPDRVEEFLGWLEMGPAGARVDSVDVRLAEVQGHDGFETR